MSKRPLDQGEGELQTAKQPRVEAANGVKLEADVSAAEHVVSLVVLILRVSGRQSPGVDAKPQRQSVHLPSASRSMHVP